MLKKLVFCAVMFNPFIPYEPKFLAAFLKKGVKAFVLQTYERGRNQFQQAVSPAYLLTHYHEIELAHKHFVKIADDVNRQIYYVGLPEDMQELQHIGHPGADILVYMSFKKPNAELQARQELDKKLRHYIANELNWRLPANTVVDFSLEFDFGEIYGVFRHGSKYHKVKLDDIDNYHAYVL